MTMQSAASEIRHLGSMAREAIEGAAEEVNAAVIAIGNKSGQELKAALAAIQNRLAKHHNNVAEILGLHNQAMLDHAAAEQAQGTAAAATPGPTLAESPSPEPAKASSPTTESSPTSTPSSSTATDTASPSATPGSLTASDLAAEVTNLHTGENETKALDPETKAAPSGTALRTYVRKNMDAENTVTTLTGLSEIKEGNVFRDLNETPERWYVALEDAWRVGADPYGVKVSVFGDDDQHAWLAEDSHPGGPATNASAGTATV